MLYIINVRFTIKTKNINHLLYKRYKHHGNPSQWESGSYHGPWDMTYFICIYMFPPHLIWDPTNLGNINLNINIILGGVSHNSPNSLRALRRTRLVGTARWRFVRSHGMLHLYNYIYIYSTYWHGLQPSLAQFLGGSTDSLVGPGEDLWGRRQRHPFASFWWGWTGPNRIFNHPGWMVRWVGTVGGTRGFPRKQRETYKKDLQGMDRWRCGFLKKISR